MRIKIFGERNTGTNAVSQLISLNSRAHIIPGTLMEFSRWKGHKTRLKRYFKFDEARLERGIDEFFLGKPFESRWKHSSTYFNPTEVNTDIFYIFMVRHPLSWLISLHKNPYHVGRSEANSNLTKFSQTFIHTKNRENMPKSQYKPLDLWDEKIHSYFKLMSFLDREQGHYCLIKFEDLILHQKRTFEILANQLGLHKSEFKYLENSTKQKSKDLNSYIRYYSSEEWRKYIPVSFDVKLIRKLKHATNLGYID